jgi:hypothetical protein
MLPLLLVLLACRFLNDVLGALCVSLYAWFDYRWAPNRQAAKPCCKCMHHYVGDRQCSRASFIVQQQCCRVCSKMLECVFECTNHTTCKLSMVAYLGMVQCSSCCCHTSQLSVIPLLLLLLLLLSPG